MVGVSWGSPGCGVFGSWCVRAAGPAAACVGGVAGREHAIACWPEPGVSGDRGVDGAAGDDVEELLEAAEFGWADQAGAEVVAGHIEARSGPAERSDRVHPVPG